MKYRILEYAGWYYPQYKPNWWPCWLSFPLYQDGCLLKQRSTNIELAKLVIDNDIAEEAKQRQINKLPDPKPIIHPYP